MTDSHRSDSGAPLAGNDFLGPNALLQAFMEDVGQPMAALGVDAEVVACNAAFRNACSRLFGREPASGERIETALADIPEEADKLSGLLGRALAGESFGVEMELGNPALARSLYTMLFAPLRDADGAVVGVTFTAQDITEAKREHTLLMESERRFRDLAANVPGVIYQWVERTDGTSGFLWVSPRLEEIFRIDRNAPGTLVQYIHPDDLARWRASIEDAKRRSGVWNFEGRLLYPDGSVRWWQGISRPSRVTAEEVVFNGVMLDITDRKLAEQELVLAAKVFESSREGIMIVDERARVLSVNRAFTAITGLRVDEVRGLPHGMFDPGRYEENHLGTLCSAAANDAGWEGEIWLVRRDEVTFPSRLRVSAVRSGRDGSGPVTHFVLIFEDISERKAQEDRIRHLAQHDFLTGLPNRGLLEDRLRQALPLAQRKGTRLAVMFLDLDRFKMINDSLGHEMGDALLKQVARRLIGCVRAADTVSRQGGDEFVVLLQDLDSPDRTAAVARKVVEVISEPFTAGGMTLNVTPSMGIAVFPEDGSDFQTLMKNADAAMYHAKSLGRNNFQFFTREINERVLERVTIESRLRSAIRAGELGVWYQPKFDLRTMEVSGLEALLRWPDGSGGYVPPDRFIPVAEDSGLIFAMGDWVMAEICRHLCAWRDARVPGVPVSSNLSAAQFRQRGLAERMRAIIEHHALDTRWLELDVTESTIMRDADAARMTLSELKALGIRLAVDDFGTGYSSLGHLKRLPLDYLKIDRSIVQGVIDDSESAATTRAIIGLARSLGLRTLAEGVETEGQLEFLKRHGCDEGQGFLLAEPMPADRVSDWLVGRPASVPLVPT
ncbi:MAG: EAL domain-containing protein [Betaproteobacteria bacterium]|nr:EAL domain-containing protein [Betaproteobacteria bacterium]